MFLKVRNNIEEAVIVSGFPLSSTGGLGIVTILESILGIGVDGT